MLLEALGAVMKAGKGIVKAGRGYHKMDHMGKKL